MKRLENKVAIVTGGATGIGEAISKKFAKEGARVVVAGFPEDPVDEVVEEIQAEGGEAIAFKNDISIDTNAKECVQKTVQAFGQLNILINNAGVFPEVNETDEFSERSVDLLLKNNIKSAVLMTKHALPELKKTKGVVISAGSEAGKQGIAQAAVYGGTKGFMHAFMQGVAVEQAKNNVRANCVAPGAIDTAWTHKETSGMDKKMEKMMIAATPLGRRGTPEEMANVYLFLASDEASFVTGSLVSADGGVTIAKGGVGKEAGKEAKSAPEGELTLEHSMEGASEESRVKEREE